MTAKQANRKTNIGAAREFLEHGLSPIPICPPNCQSTHSGKLCTNPGKTPLVRWKGFRDKPPTHKKISRWFDVWFTANVGIVLGGVSRVIRIDVDGEQGERFLIEASGGNLPPTVEFRRGSHSRGLLYRMPDGVDLKTTTLSGDGDHQELRFQSTGCYSVVPPSRHVSGDFYEWQAGRGIGEIAIAEAPAWLVERMTVPPRSNEVFWSRPSNPRDRQLALEALQHINPELGYDYDTWLKVGMALHCVDQSAEMLGVWMEWSADTCPGKFDADVCESKWLSFKSDPFARQVTLGTLIYWARQNGWQPLVALSNYVKEGDDKIPLPMSDILSNIDTMTGGQPYRMGNALFVDDDTEGVRWLPKPASLFSWIGETTHYPARFSKGNGFHTKEEVFAGLESRAKAFEAVELFPHFPPLAGHYYACEWPESGDGATMTRLLARFTPETEADRHLIHAMLATLLWGGGPGTRPMFIITADSGTGAGKTTLANIAAELVGGAIARRKNENVDDFIKRLLSPVGLKQRVAIIDNVKTRRFSQGDFEALITAPVISGHRLYVGEGRRPNVLTYLVTLNDPALSRDLAQRSIPVKLGVPAYNPSWEADTKQFIARHRAQLLGDLRRLFDAPPGQLETFTRWQAWERDILTKLPDPDGLQAVIRERQATYDTDREKWTTVEDHFRQQLDKLGYDTETQRIFIPSEVAIDWLNDADGELRTTIAGGRELTNAIRARMFGCIQELKAKSYGRGYVWHGAQSLQGATLATDLNARRDQDRNLCPSLL